MNKALIPILLLVLVGCADQPPDSSSQAGAVLAPAAARPAPASTFSAAFLLGVSVTLTSTLDCQNSPGPNITLNGELALGGLNGKLIFRNNLIGTHEHTEDVVFDIVLIPEGETISFAKQPPLGGVGGNPHIWFQLTDADGNPVSEEWYLGRCVQGSK